jgi:hypothetical protein
LAISRRASLLSIFLILATAAVGVRTYLLWGNGGTDLVAPRRSGVPGPLAQTQVESKPLPAVGTQTIVTHNLFDPERGAGAGKEFNADSRSAQRVTSLVLLGTAILGFNRYVTFQEPAPNA